MVAESQRRDGVRVLTAGNGTRKEIHPDGRCVVCFYNGDVKETLPDGQVSRRASWRDRILGNRLTSMGANMQLQGSVELREINAHSHSLTYPHSQMHAFIRKLVCPCSPCCVCCCPCLVADLTQGYVSLCGGAHDTHGATGRPRGV